VLNDFDQWQVQVGDVALNVADCKLTLSKDDPVRNALKEPTFLRPVLRTAHERPRRANLKENLLALIKRNFNAPELTGIVDIEASASFAVDRFFECFIDKSDNSLGSLRLRCRETLQRWLDNQEPATLKRLANFDTSALPAIDQYSHMIKSQPKCRLDTSVQSEYGALQTIVFHSKEVNSIFGPIFQELTRVLLSSIDQNRFLFYTRKSASDVEGFFSGISTNSNYEVLELDISKYDKSQNDFHCAVEYEIWKRLGFDDFLLSVWEMGHRKTFLTDFKAGIKACIWYQRKSGDVTTFIGNTVLVATCLATLIPLENCLKAAFCGDDSLIFMPKGFNSDDVQVRANLAWNFEAKLFKKHIGYFCGKYVIIHDSGCTIYPDPLKLISKLGAKSIKDWNHLEETRVSLMDNAGNYGNCAYFPHLDEAIAEVFPAAVGGRFAFCALYKFLSDKVLFRSLFDGN